MKKSLIAGAGATAFAFAALPFAGVFADPTPAGTVTDNLTVNIPAACTIVNNNSTTGGDGSAPALTNSYTVSMSNGQFKTNIGASAADATQSTTPDNSIDVSCNSTDGTDPAIGWKLTAIGAGTAGHITELYNADATDQIVTGTAVDGATSNWAMKVAIPGSGVNYANGWNADYKAVPSAETDVATGTGSVSSAFTMTYQVYVDQTQDAGTYTGAVKYTLYNPAS